MKTLITIKQNVDRFNFFLNTTGGAFVMSVLYFIPESIGITSFFAMLFQNRAETSGAHFGDKYVYLLGFLFSLMVFATIYYFALNRKRGAARFVTFLAVMLSVISYWSTLSQFTGDNFAVLAVGVFIVSFLPGYGLDFTVEMMVSKMGAIVSTWQKTITEVDKDITENIKSEIDGVLKGNPKQGANGMGDQERKKLLKKVG